MFTSFDAKKRYPTHLHGQKIEGYGLFSSSAFFDPANQFFGELYSFSDYRCRPGYGIPRHPHEFFEVVCILLSGMMHFQDNLGNDIINESGTSHVFSSSKGYLHSSSVVGEEEMRFVSMWLRPVERLDKPTYSRSTDSISNMKPGEIRKIFYHRGNHQPLALHLNADAEISIGLLDQNLVKFVCEPVGIGLLYVTDGAMVVNDIRIEKGGHVRFEREPVLTLQGDPEGRFIVVAMPSS